MLIDYFESAPLREIPDQNLTGKGSAKAAAIAICAEVPTFQAFAATLNTTPQILLDWRERHPAFKQAYARAKAMQERHFIIGLTQGTMNATGAIFVAKNILGWRDKQDIELTGPDGGPVTSKLALEFVLPGIVRQQQADAVTIDAAAEAVTLPTPQDTD